MPIDVHNPEAAPELSDGMAPAFRSLTERLKPPVQVPHWAQGQRLPPHAYLAPPASPAAAAGQLIDIMWGAVNLPPQERAMAGDTLLLLLPLLAAGELATVAARVASMDRPPPLVVSYLLHEADPDIGNLLLERSGSIERAELLAACRQAAPKRLRLLARRRQVPAELGDHIIRAGDLPSLVELLRNNGAEISFDGFRRLSELAGNWPVLQAPLTLRPDLPLAVALDLLWRLPPELRRVIILRFLSDSMTLGRILSIGLAAADAPSGLVTALPWGRFQAALDPLFAGQLGEACRRIARASGLAEETVLRVFSDPQGEALVVLLKALGLSRSLFDETLERLRRVEGLLVAGRPSRELKAVFEALSFTKARVLLTYWDWHARQVGPFAPPPAPDLVEAAPLA